MKRLNCSPRNNWQKLVENKGLLFHHTDDGQYWNEGTYYEFTSTEIDEIELATNNLQELSLAAVQNVIDNKRYSEFDIPINAIEMIERSWEEEHPALYGRMDLAYNNGKPAKLLEYNADTPTSLLEAAIIQWYWLQDMFPKKDQFNSIHEKLIEKWKELIPYFKGETTHFTSMKTIEDEMTIGYLRDTAEQAGVKTKYIIIDDIGWDKDTNCFVDMEYRSILNLFKLYPWEWLLKDEFSQHISKADMFVMEPAWKMILSNKAILAVLWEMNPGHPNLLPASLTYNKDMFKNSYVKKPLLGREGSNVTISTSEVNLVTPGSYDDGKFLYQAYEPLPNFDGNVPVIGSWLIDGFSSGIGIRETKGLVTNNTAMFVPHLF